MALIQRPSLKGCIMILKTLQQYKSYAEEQGLIVYAIMLKGSQNYNLADSESDIDANLIFIPTLSQLRSGESFKYTFDTGEVTCHNIYKFAEIASKGNPQWIEVCHTEYHLGESLDMFKHLQVNPSALKGMVMEKVVAFDKLYPSREVYVTKYGYDPKQLHHIIRLYDSLVSGDPIHKYYGEERDYMLAIKRGSILSKEEAFTLRDKYVTKLASIYEQKKLEYTPQTVDVSSLDSIVLKHLCKSHTKAI